MSRIGIPPFLEGMGRENVPQIKAWRERGKTVVLTGLGTGTPAIRFRCGKENEMKTRFMRHFRHMAKTVPAIVICAAMLLSTSSAQAENEAEPLADDATEKTVSMTINKRWSGDTGHENQRPSQLEVAVRNNQTGQNVRIVTLSADKNWTTTVNGLPYVKDSEGHLDYSVSETTVPDGYEQSSSIMTNQTTKDLELWTLANGLDNNSLDGKFFVILNGNSGDVQLLRAEGPTDGVMTAPQHVFTDPLTVNGENYNSYGYIGKGTDGYTVEQSLGWTAMGKGVGYVLRSNMLENDPTLHRIAYLTVDKKAHTSLPPISRKPPFSNTIRPADR